VETGQDNLKNRFGVRKRRPNGQPKIACSTRGFQRWQLDFAIGEKLAGCEHVFRRSSIQSVCEHNVGGMLVLLKSWVRDGQEIDGRIMLENREVVKLV
jgi:hypothetical protein